LSFRAASAYIGTKHDLVLLLGQVHVAITDQRIIIHHRAREARDVRIFPLHVVLTSEAARKHKPPLVAKIAPVECKGDDAKRAHLWLGDKVDLIELLACELDTLWVCALLVTNGDVVDTIEFVRAF